MGPGHLRETAHQVRAPPIADELPRILELVLGNEVYIAREGLPPALRNRRLRIAAFQNPEFYKAQAMRLPTYEKPRAISCAGEHPHHIGLPRGCLERMEPVKRAAVLQALQHDGTIMDAFDPNRPADESATMVIVWIAVEDCSALAWEHFVLSGRREGPGKSL